MGNLAFRSFTTFGYFAAALLIAIVAILFLTSLGDDSSGSQAVNSTTPTPTHAGATLAITNPPAGDGNLWIDPTCAAGAAIGAYGDEGVTIRKIRGRNALTADALTGDKTPECP